MAHAAIFPTHKVLNYNPSRPLAAGSTTAERAESEPSPAVVQSRKRPPPLCRTRRRSGWVDFLSYLCTSNGRHDVGHPNHK